MFLKAQAQKKIRSSVSRKETEQVLAFEGTWNTRDEGWVALGHGAVVLAAVPL